MATPAIADNHLRTSIGNFVETTRFGWPKIAQAEQSNGWLCFGVRVIRGGPSYGYPFYSDPNRFTHNMALIQLPTYEDQSMTGTFLEVLKKG